MSQELRTVLENMRRMVIQLCDLLDNVLEHERYIPSKKDRFLLKQLRDLPPSEFNDILEKYKIKYI